MTGNEKSNELACSLPHPSLPPPLSNFSSLSLSPSLSLLSNFFVVAPVFHTRVRAEKWKGCVITHAFFRSIQITFPLLSSPQN